MKKLNGYRPSHRNKWRFIQNGILTLQELTLLEFYADIVDFGKNHENYGRFEVNFDEIASVFKCSSNTIRNWHNKLLILGFIEKTPKRSWLKLICHERYINPGKWGGQAKHYQEIEKNQSIEIILQSFGINFQSIEEQLQRIKKTSKENNIATTKNVSIAIDSYKNEYKNSFLPPMQSNSQRIMENYKQIKKEMGFNFLLTEEDMKWIDENIREDINVPS